MDVILLQDVEQVGLRGDVVSVARGYMRNYLEPRGLAQPATPALLGELAKREDQRARHEARSVEQAQEIADTLTKTVLRFEVKSGPRGRLFGSVTPTDIVDELWRARRIRVDRRKIDLPETIKRVGRYEVPVTIFEDVRVEVKTLVVPEGGEVPSEDEIAAWEAEERAEAEAAAGLEEQAEAEEEAEQGAGATDVEGPAEAEGEATAPGEAAAEGAEPAQETDEPDEVEAAWQEREAGEPEPAPGPDADAEPAPEPEAEPEPDAAQAEPAADEQQA
jgi:large subunit ribosomal protein L9